MGISVDNTSSVLHARKDNIKGSTQLSFDNALVKSLDTINSFSGLTFTSVDLGKSYLYLGNEAGYTTNSIYKIVLSGNTYLPQLDNSLSPSNKVDKINLGSTINNSLVKITTNNQGQVTSSSNVTASDIPGLSSKQDTIDTDHKLSSDLVDDTNHDHKFVTQNQISQLSSLVSIVGDQNSGLIKAVNDLDNNKVDKINKLHEETWIDDTERTSTGKITGRVDVIFKPTVITDQSVIKVKSFSILNRESSMPSNPVYIKILDINQNPLSDKSDNVTMTATTYSKFTFTEPVELDKNGWYRIRFYDSVSNNDIATGLYINDQMDSNTNDLYIVILPQYTSRRDWRPLTKFEYEYDELGNITTDSLVKITTNVQGQVTKVTKVTDSDIPTLPQSKITNLTTDLGNKVTKNNDITGATKCKITYDSKGLVTSGSDLTESDIPTLSQSKITNLTTDLGNKQDTLVSGTNIKTINNGSILGEGNVDLLPASTTYVESVSGETALIGGTANDLYVSVSATTNNKAVTLDSKVKVQPVSSADSSNQGLAESSDVKNYVDTKVSSVYKPKGTLSSTDLISSLLVVSNLGNVYNISDSFVTTNDFVEGAGKSYPAGTNVVIIDNGTSQSPSYKFDVLAGFVDLSGKVDKINLSTTINNSLVKITTNNQGQVISSSEVTKSDIPTIDESQVANLTTDLSNKVDKTTTIAGVDLQDNVTKSELLTALNVSDGAQVNAVNSVGNGLQVDGNKEVSIKLDGSTLSVSSSGLKVGTLTESDIPNLSQSKITNLTTDLSNKVDKVANKDLVSNSDITQISTNATNISNLLSILSGLSIPNSYEDTSIEDIHGVLVSILNRLGGGSSTPTVINELTVAKLKDTYYKYVPAITGSPLLDSSIPVTLTPFSNNTLTPVDNTEYYVTAVDSAQINGVMRDLWFVVDCTLLSTAPTLSWDTTIFTAMDGDNSNMTLDPSCINVFMLSEYRSGKFMVAKKKFEEVA